VLIQQKYAVSAKFDDSAKIPGDDLANICCISQKFGESAKFAKIPGDDSSKIFYISKKFEESAKNELIQQNTLCQQKLTVSAKMPGDDSTKDAK